MVTETVYSHVSGSTDPGFQMQTTLRPPKRSKPAPIVTVRLGCPHTAGASSDASSSSSLSGASKHTVLLDDLKAKLEAYERVGDVLECVRTFLRQLRKLGIPEQSVSISHSTCSHAHRSTALHAVRRFKTIATVCEDAPSPHGHVLE